VIAFATHVWLFCAPFLALKNGIVMYRAKVSARTSTDPPSVAMLPTSHALSGVANNNQPSKGNAF
jgi:hypothetical protein